MIDMKIKAKVEGLCCAHCAAKIEERIAALDGVESASVSILTEKIIIVCDADKTDAIKLEAERIAKKIEPDVSVAFI